MYLTKLIDKILQLQSKFSQAVYNDYYKVSTLYKLGVFLTAYRKYFTYEKSKYPGKLYILTLLTSIKVKFVLYWVPRFSADKV